MRIVLLVWVRTSLMWYNVLKNPLYNYILDTLLWLMNMGTCDWTKPPLLMLSCDSRNERQDW